MLSCRRLACLLLCLALWCTQGVRAADLDDAEALFAAGEYDACQAVAADAVERGIWNVRWPMLLIRCQMTTGQYPAALETYQAASKRFTFNALPLQLQGVEVFRMNNLPDEAEQELVRIHDRVRDSLNRFMSKESMIAIGRYLATRGEDARQILERFYDRSIESDPKFVDAYVASAELALQKHDYQLAASAIEKAIPLQPDDPYLYYLQSRAWKGGDPERSAAALQLALEKNPRHIPSLLYQAEQAIDSEQYDEAHRFVTEVLQVNLHQPEAWAFEAVLAHLRGQPEIEALMRAAALSTWSTNPEVDHLIGVKLSQKYRFTEGAAYQRRALAVRPQSTKYRFQLAQDLLHLGDDEAGWTLAEQTQQDDPYNSVAYNLMTLHDSLEQFQTFQADGILLRMDAFEASVYGEQALKLLQTAKRELSEKYSVELKKQIIVEIFPKQSDFAIRTFGLPGGAGYLGVCFGRLVTANSPASQGAAPANWQSVLWHEFCHVVTLEKTRNRMPRWLSEGLSVYEERQRDGRWGQQLNPTFREMILSEDLTPVSELSGAFLSPKSAMHVQFAYFESSMVVEYFIDKYGIDAMNRLLDDLAVGMPINDALQRHAGSLAALDAEFAEYARQAAEAFGPTADWERPTAEGPPSLAQWRERLEQSPNHYWALRAVAQAEVAAERDAEAIELLDRLDAILPADGSPGCATELRARLAARQGDVTTELKHLQALHRLRDDDLPTYRRIAEIAIEREDWELLASMSAAMLAVNPLLPAGHEWLAEAGEQLQRPADTVRALAALSRMEQVDPAGLHYRWAVALEKLDRNAEAKRQVLMALEYAPRYRDAYRLLTKLNTDKVTP